MVIRNALEALPIATKARRLQALWPLIEQKLIAGTSHADILRALNDSGRARGLAVHANTQSAQKMADFLKELGYDAPIAATGQDAFRVASERMDIELVVVDANVARWGLSQTIANFRADARTAPIPIKAQVEGSGIAVPAANAGLAVSSRTRPVAARMPLLPAQIGHSASLQTALSRRGTVNRARAGLLRAAPRAPRPRRRRGGGGI